MREIILTNNTLSILHQYECVPDGYTFTLETKTHSKQAIKFSHYFTPLGETERTIFFILYLIFFSLSIIANIGTLLTTHQRKLRLLQKSLIISLAISDIWVCFFFGVNNMINYSKPMMNWVLGEFMCSFLPFAQQIGTLSNAFSIILIAYDRYKNIVYPLNQQWNPNIYLCVCFIICIWGFAASISVPMYILMKFSPIIVIQTNQIPCVVSTEQLHLFVCSTSDKELQKLFYIIIFSFIFIPLMVMFLWLYYKIAKLIWKRRKPLKVFESNSKNNSVTIETSADSSISMGKVPNPVIIQVNKAVKADVKYNKIHMQKKIKTFKIILIIMAVFFICRMPHYVFNLVKYSTKLNGSKHWVIANVFTFFLILNTALNPFLYSFLNESVYFFDKFFISIRDFFFEVCCCCCSNIEFADFEQDNPFYMENYNQRPSQTSSIIHKIPYAAKTNHVKFQEVPAIKLYSEENTSENVSNSRTV